MKFNFIIQSVTNVLLYLQDFNLISICIRLFLAAIFGGLLGAERGKKRFGAGARTFALVCLGSAVTIIVNEYVQMKANNVIDPARMASQIINGVGFLGAGTIMVTGNNRVKGLTTAASLWVAAIIGIAVGSGFIIGSIFGFILALSSIVFLQRYNDWFAKFDRVIELYLEIDSKIGLEQVNAYVAENKFLIRSMRRKKQKPLFAGDQCIIIEFDMGGRKDHASVLTSLQQVEGIHYFEEI